MNTKVQARITMDEVNVSKGMVRPTEVALWVGPCNLKHPINGTRLLMGVSRDKDWFWLRFSHELWPADNALLVNAGMSFSKKKRLGYSAASTPAIAKLIRQLGWDGAQHFTYTPPKPVIKAPPTATPNEGKANGTITSKETNMSWNELRKNSAGRWVDGKGQFVSVKVTNGKAQVSETVNAKRTPYEQGFMVGVFDCAAGHGMAPDSGHTGEDFEQFVLGYLKGYRGEAGKTPSPQEIALHLGADVPEVETHVFEPSDEQVELGHRMRLHPDGYVIFGDGSVVVDEPPVKESKTPAKVVSETPVTYSNVVELQKYNDGYASGQVDAADEEIPGIYDATALARFLEMTVTDMHAAVGTSYVDGWLTGFSDARPKPARLGIRAAFGK